MELGDTVRVKSTADVVTIVGTRSSEPMWQVQRGNDGASVQWKRTDELEFVAKSNKPDTSPGLVPERGIMD